MRNLRIGLIEFHRIFEIFNGGVHFILSFHYYRRVAGLSDEPEVCIRLVVFVTIIL